jgi:hypothetical protein
MTAKHGHAPPAFHGFALPTYYECGICGCYHPREWDGDCRENENRFAPDELDARHGPLGWDAVAMPTWEDSP